MKKDLQAQMKEAFELLSKQKGISMESMKEYIEEILIKVFQRDKNTEYELEEDQEFELGDVAQCADVFAQSLH